MVILKICIFTEFFECSSNNQKLIINRSNFSAKLSKITNKETNLSEVQSNLKISNIRKYVFFRTKQKAQQTNHKYDNLHSVQIS